MTLGLRGIWEFGDPFAEFVNYFWVLPEFVNFSFNGRIHDQQLFFAIKFHKLPSRFIPGILDELHSKGYNTLTSMP